MARSRYIALYCLLLSLSSASNVAYESRQASDIPDYVINYGMKLEELE